MSNSIDPVALAASASPAASATNASLAVVPEAAASAAPGFGHFIAQSDAIGQGLFVIRCTSG